MVRRSKSDHGNNSDLFSSVDLITDHHQPLEPECRARTSPIIGKVLRKVICNLDALVDDTPKGYPPS